jgi:low affinity Fe/Cu permease
VSQQAGRYPRTFGGMVGAMVVLVALVLVWVGFRALTSSQPATPVQRIDYAQEVPLARKAANFRLLAPPRLPAGWHATTVTFTDTVPQHWHLGVLTARDRYVGLEQAQQPRGSMVAAYVAKDASRGAPVQVGGHTWSTYTDSQGDLALVRRGARGTTTLVVGHDVPRSDLLDYVASLR